MDMSNNTRRATLAWAIAGALSLGAPIAQAQNFEAYYGEKAATDVGQDVKAVFACPDKGSVIAGSRRVDNQIQALVSRIDDKGTPLWQFAYRVRESDTVANAIVELKDGSGFALTGSVSLTDNYIYVLMLDCDGKPRWTTVLDNLGAGHRATGHDITQASLPGGPLELIVIGDEASSTPVATTQGRIARLKASGSVLWDYAYNQPATTTPGVRFRGVTLAHAVTGAPTDIVVAGSAAAGTSWSADRRALMFRVDANGTPVCDAMLGNTDSTNEDYLGAALITSAPNTGETVLAGASQFATAPTPQGAYLTRFRAGTCVPLAQAYWRDPSDGATAYDVAESTGISGTPTSFVANGTIRGTSTAGDGFVVLANPTNLAPMLAPSRFSTISARVENLVALDRKGDRLVMSGSTQTDWDGSGDPQDFYFVQTDPALDTQCSVNWSMQYVPTQLPYQRFIPVRATITNASPTETLMIDAKDHGYCCTIDPH